MKSAPLFCFTETHANYYRLLHELPRTFTEKRHRIIQPPLYGKSIKKARWHSHRAFQTLVGTN